VRPDSDFGFSPREQDVGMVALLLGDCAHAIHEVERLLKIRKLERAREVMLVDNLPVWKLVGEIVRVLPAEIPVPDSGTVTLGTFEDTVSVPVKLPTLFGTNLTMKVTLLKEARLSGVVIPENLKDPVTATWEIFMVARVRLVKVRYV